MNKSYARKKMVMLEDLRKRRQALRYCMYRTMDGHHCSTDKGTSYDLLS